MNKLIIRGGLFVSVAAFLLCMTAAPGYAQDCCAEKTGCTEAQKAACQKANGPAKCCDTPCETPTPDCCDAVKAGKTVATSSKATSAPVIKKCCATWQITTLAKKAGCCDKSAAKVASIALKGGCPTARTTQIKAVAAKVGCCPTSSEKLAKAAIGVADKKAPKATLVSAKGSCKKTQVTTLAKKAGCCDKSAAKVASIALKGGCPTARTTEIKAVAAKVGYCPKCATKLADTCIKVADSK